jgi:hypothetical protein
LAVRNFIDIQHLLKASLMPPKMLIVLASACGVWIALISGAVACFAGTGLSAAWICGGVLVLALAVWTLVMVGEYRNAIDLDERPGYAGAEGRWHRSFSRPRRVFRVPGSLDSSDGRDAAAWQRRGRSIPVSRRRQRPARPVLR